MCELGQTELMETRYLDAADTLGKAEQQAWETGSFDTLARLYLPMQEAHRQIRQRCGEGAVRLHMFPSNPTDSMNPLQILQATPHGQLLVGGWETIRPAVELRRLVKQQRLYVETFLGSVQTSEDGQRVVKILPLEDWQGTCLVLKPEEIPVDAAKGNAETFAGVMAIWERLHRPFLSAAEKEPDPIRRMQAYRLTLRVDRACELAHQYLAEIARRLARTK